MGTKVGINGFGRVGRYALRAILRRDDVTAMAINSRADMMVNRPDLK